MTKQLKAKLFILVSIFIIPTLIIVPSPVLGDVKPITEMEDKLEGISKEQKEVLEDLFALAQEIDEMEREEIKVSGEIDALELQIKNLANGIDEKQKSYDLQLAVLRKVLINYQRGGPASYLEILLSADNLTTFLKSINLIKDISRNTGELLSTLEDGKKELQTEKDSLDQTKLLLEQSKVELQESLHKKQGLQQEQELFLASLQEQQVFYEEQLSNLETMWKDCQILFSEIVEETTTVVGAGYFTVEDMNLSFGFTKISGAIKEDTFNRILKENSKLPETIFRFQNDRIIIEVPDKHLVLTGKFVITGKSSVLYEVEEGTFFDMPLEPASIQELFKDGHMLIDFRTIAGDMIIIDFTLNKVGSHDGRLEFEIKPEW